MYIAAAQGQTTPRGQNFDVNRNLLSLRSFATRFKNIYLKSDFTHIFHFVYSPGAGADNPLGTKFWCEQEHLVTSVICYKFQKNLFEVWFYRFFFFFFFLHVYSPGQKLTAPRGQSFDVNKNVSSLYSFVASLKKNLILYNTLNALIHVCSPIKAAAANNQGTKFWCQQKCLDTSFIFCMFQKNVFEVWFYTFFSWFITCI